MMYRLAKFIFWVAVLFSANGYGRDAAIATGSGNTKLNGHALMRPSAVFTGDELETAADSAIVVHAKGFSVQVGPMATSFVEKRALLLMTGTAQARGLVDILAGQLRVISDSADARFMVSCSGGTVSVIVKAGAVIVRQGQWRVILRAGESRTFEKADSVTTVPKAGKHTTLAPKAGVGVAAGSGIGAAIAKHLGDGEPAQISKGRSPH